ncbi:MAG TPA: ATP-binding cassette domain-containing protein [Baekduia sp.]|uniref:ATP-binding cassette domain-containing protein n=1 Tax=Baekduia sp. TaxID=2600305 RepID=UPI002D76A569|nr:ATP-binding cassette domain-containing protein [Baekduia sp.]HET6507825.1 ATP-binding cassette domain-containing protein [Baekduia sp.]
MTDTPPPTATDAGQRPPALVARGIVKRYGHVEALKGADFECRAGEVTALIGDNGAGKSTLVKILSGTALPDAGTITVNGAEYRPDSPAASHTAGIETVYQDLALAPDLGPAANLFLGRERRRAGLLGRLGFMDDRAMRDDATRTFAELGVTADTSRASVRALSGGQRQGVAVARAVAWGRSIVLLDEPTAALGVVQTQNVLRLVRTVADSGIAVVLISHSMPDVLAVADRIEVLRLGRRVARFTRAEASVDRLVAAMTGGAEAAAPAAGLADINGGHPA